MSGARSHKWQLLVVLCGAPGRPSREGSQAPSIPGHYWPSAGTCAARQVSACTAWRGPPLQAHQSEQGVCSVISIQCRCASKSPYRGGVASPARQLCDFCTIFKVMNCDVALRQLERLPEWECRPQHNRTRTPKAMVSGTLHRDRANVSNKLLC